VLQEREGERQQRYVSEPVRRKYSISWPLILLGSSGT
jgi:hypothetical protein